MLKKMSQNKSITLIFIISILVTSQVKTMHLFCGTKPGKIQSIDMSEKNPKTWNLKEITRTKRDNLNYNDCAALLYRPDKKCVVFVGIHDPGFEHEMGVNTVEIWHISDKNPQAWNLITKWQSPSEIITFSPDGNFLVSALYCADIEARNTSNTNPKKWSIIKTLKNHTHKITSICFTPNSKHMASGSLNKVNIWNTKTWCIISKFKDIKDVSSLTYNKNGKKLFVGDWHGNVTIFHSSDHKNKAYEKIQTLKIHTTPFNSVSSILFILNNKYIAFGANNGSIKIYNSKTLKAAKAFENTESSGRVLAYNPHCHHLATGTYDGTINILNISDAKPKKWKLVKTLKQDNNSVNALFFMDSNPKKLIAKKDLLERVRFVKKYFNNS